MPAAPATVTGCGASPAATAASTLPSPPSASGMRRLSTPADAKPCATWSATSDAVRLPLNLSGAIRTRTETSSYP
ncbi:Uncharacterised protein [Mycobacteroides abscessus subsp. abscessus]|nr:Uncharacterised protein [Mycobacteroides abscessus subsp. abscessus]